MMLNDIIEFLFHILPWICALLLLFAFAFEVVDALQRITREEEHRAQASELPTLDRPRGGGSKRGRLGYRFADDPATCMGVEEGDELCVEAAEGTNGTMGVTRVDDAG